MTARMACPMSEQAVGWALHTLEPDDEITVVDHLPRCAECRRLVAETEEVAAALGASVEPVEPPPGLRASIIDLAARTPQETGHPATGRPAPPARRAPVGDPRRPGDPGPAASAGRPASHRSVPAPRTGRGGGPDDGPDRSGPGRSRRGRRGRLLAAGLAVVAVLGFGGLTARTIQLQHERDAQTTQSQTIAGVLAEIAQPGTRHATLAGPDGVPAAAVLEHDGQRELVTLALAGNDPRTQTYVLWGLSDGRAPTAISPFDVTTADLARHGVGPEAGSGFSGYAISLEPGRAMPAEPTAVVASGQVAV